MQSKVVSHAHVSAGALSSELLSMHAQRKFGISLPHPWRQFEKLPLTLTVDLT